MIQRGGRARFLIESREATRVAGEGRRQYLDRDVTNEPSVPRPIDFAHAARAEGREDFVGTEAGAGESGTSGWGIIRAGCRGAGVQRAGCSVQGCRVQRAGCSVQGAPAVSASGIASAPRFLPDSSSSRSMRRRRGRPGPVRAQPVAGSSVGDPHRPPDGCAFRGVTPGRCERSVQTACGSSSRTLRRCSPAPSSPSP